MTVEIDPARVAAVTDRLGRHLGTVAAIARHLGELGRRIDLIAEVAPAVGVGERVVERLTLARDLLVRRAEQAIAADDRTAGDELRSFAGGSALCSAIQFVSPIPGRPSTEGISGAIDAAGIARDVASLADAATARSLIAGRAIPVAALAAALVDTVLCRLRVGSGAPISTRTTVDEDGRQIYEGSRSPHKNMTDTGETLHPDVVRRDRQMWRVEHSNQQGHLTELYPGYPAYEVNAPRR